MTEDEPEKSNIFPLRAGAASAESEEERQQRLEREGWSRPHGLGDRARLRAALRAKARGENTFAVNADDVLHVLDEYQEQVNAAIAEIVDKLNKPTIWTPGR